MKKLFKNPLTIFVVAIAVIAASSVGATRAAITVISDQDEISFSTGEVSVQLIENGVDVETDDEATALTLGIGEDSFKIGQKYLDAVSVVNNSTIVVNDDNGNVTDTYHYDEYVRVILTKSWYDAAGNKDTLLDPSLIDLNVLTDNGWIKDESSSTSEQEIYYYSKPVAYGEEIPFADTFMVKQDVNELITKSGTTGNITTTYDYDGKSFEVEIEVDAVQTHHAAEAILGAWGVNVNIADDGSLSLLGNQLADQTSTTEEGEN